MLNRMIPTVPYTHSVMKMALKTSKEILRKLENTKVKDLRKHLDFCDTGPFVEPKVYCFLSGIGEIDILGNYLRKSKSSRKGLGYTSPEERLLLLDNVKEQKFVVLREFYNAFAGAFLEHDYKRQFGGGTRSVIQALSDEELETSLSLRKNDARHRIRGS